MCLGFGRFYVASFAPPIGCTSMQLHADLSPSIGRAPGNEKPSVSLAVSTVLPSLGEMCKGSLRKNEDVNGVSRLHSMAQPSVPKGEARLVKKFLSLEIHFKSIRHHRLYRAPPCLVFPEFLTLFFHDPLTLHAVSVSGFFLFCFILKVPTLCLVSVHTRCMSSFFLYCTCLLCDDLCITFLC